MRVLSVNAGLPREACYSTPPEAQPPSLHLTRGGSATDGHEAQRLDIGMTEGSCDEAVTTACSLL